MGGFFLSFEGIDGAGKTTQVEKLAQRLRSAGLNVVTVREPGGTILGEAVRNIVQDPVRTEIEPPAEACLYAAARAQLVAQVILPALKEDKIVVADRFADSTVAYQGAGRGLPEELLNALNAMVTRGLVPDLTVIIDVPVEEALARLRGTRSSDRMEMLEPAFFERVRERYLSLAARSGSRFAVVDGTKSPEEVADQIFALVRKGLVNCTTTSGDRITQSRG
ncbi:MAG: dTMP kinase [Ammonifex sp.]|jgi:dTMP kinase|nr:MAG: dTMP kinase [Ammonifex sp.]